MCLTGGFLLVELIGGILAGSLALIADAGHMLTDTASLALAWFAFRMARRPADWRRSYGYHRFEILAAFTNGLTLLFIAGWILIEAARRLIAPVEVLGGLMLAVAAAGLAVNIVALLVLHGGRRENLNLQGAALHVMGDLLGSAAAIAAALIILWTGWMPIDPLLSALVALLILRSALLVVRRSGHILLEGTPEDLDPERLRESLHAEIPAVQDVHHIHAWSLTAERPIVTLHVAIDERADAHESLIAVKALLKARFGLDHVTVQIEPVHCPDQPPSGAAGNSA